MLEFMIKYIIGLTLGGIVTLKTGSINLGNIVTTILFVVGILTSNKIKFKAISEEEYDKMVEEDEDEK